MTTPIQRASYLEAHSRPDTPPAPKNLAPINNSPTFLRLLDQQEYIWAEKTKQKTHHLVALVLYLFFKESLVPLVFSTHSLE